MVVVVLLAGAAVARAGGPDPDRSGDAGPQEPARAQRPRSRSPAPDAPRDGPAPDARRGTEPAPPGRDGKSPGRTAAPAVDGPPAQSADAPADTPGTETSAVVGPGAAVAEPGEGETAASAEKSSKALERAKAEAGKLKSTLADPGALGGAALPPGGRRGEAPPAATAGLDAITAYAAGYAPVYKEMGLRVGRGPDGRLAVLDVAGGAAGAGALAALRARLDSEPHALMRRPDFFEVIDRSRYDELKTRHAAAGPEPGDEFRDIGLTERRRDFVWTASCARVSGDCNAAAAEAAYKKGDDVSPETLLSVWKRIKAANGGVWAARGNDRAEAAPPAPTGRAAGLLDRVRRALAALTGEPAGSAAGPPDPGSGASAADDSAAPGAGREPRAGRSAAPASAPSPRRAAFAKAPPDARRTPAEPASLPWVRIALAAAGLGLLASAGLRLRRTR